MEELKTRIHAIEHVMLPMVVSKFADGTINTEKLSMKNLNKYFLSIIFISLVTFLSAEENIYEYKIRFKIKNVISLDGIKELTSKGNDSYHIIFTGKNRMLNAELNQEAEFKYLNSKVFPKYYSQ